MGKVGRPTARWWKVSVSVGLRHCHVIGQKRSRALSRGKVARYRGALSTRVYRLSGEERTSHSLVGVSTCDFQLGGACASPRRIPTAHPRQGREPPEVGSIRIITEQLKRVTSASSRFFRLSEWAPWRARRARDKHGCHSRRSYLLEIFAVSPTIILNDVTSRASEFMP